MEKLFMLVAGAVIASPIAASTAWAQAAQKDPDAIAALHKMGAALRGLQSFGVHADVIEEEVLTTGQKLQSSGTIDIKARRPNAIRMDVKSDKKERTLYYDGKNATLFSPRLGYYATFAAPPTIAEMLKAASEKYAIETPLADLFAWGGGTDPAAQLQSAFRVGTETINGQICDHYAMRQTGNDWQVWIQQGANALPCKLVITTTDDPSMPQYSAVYRWAPQENHAARTFVFTPPPNARKIAFLPAPPSSR